MAKRKKKVKGKEWSKEKFARCVAEVKKKDGSIKDPEAVCAARMRGTTKPKKKKKRR